MKKAFLVAGSVVLMALTAQAQSKKDPLPPPPPPAPPAELIVDAPPPPPPPPPQAEALPDDHKAFLKRNPSVKFLGWTHRDEVIVRLKSGKEERYKLDEKGIEQAETKYGKLPTAPPPPPPPPAPPKAPVPPKE